MAKVNQVERASRAWPVLTAIAKKGKTITYGELAEVLGIHHRPIRYVLGVLQDYCLAEKLPPLTILVVNQSGEPGPGFIAHSFDDLEAGYSEVWGPLATVMVWGLAASSILTLFLIPSAYIAMGDFRRLVYARRSRDERVARLKWKEKKRRRRELAEIDQPTS